MIPNEAQFVVKYFPPQIKNFTFLADKNNSKFSETYYHRILNNNEQIHSPWLVYSTSLNSVFCPPCKLFYTVVGEICEHLLYGAKGVSVWKRLATVLKTLI